MWMMRSTLSIIRNTIGILCILGVSCNGCISDVPHDNPLDPLSANPLSGATLSGRVVVKNQSSVGIAGAVVSVIPGSMIAVTDSLGNFAFQNLTTEIQSVVVHKANFMTDTETVSLNRGQSRQLTIQLNAIPTVPSVRIVTRKIDQWWPNPIYSATVIASVDDLNGVIDLDSVWVSVDSLKFGMSYSVSNKNFNAVIDASQLPSNTLEWLIGKQFFVRARDKNNAIGISSPGYAPRIIENEATPIYPALLDTAAASPEFSWTPPTATFPYTYTITVVRIDAGTQTVIWTQPGIGSYLRAFQYADVLQAGNYFWTIAIVDEYGDIAQSKQSSFVVKD
jgi:hypothetical protein